MATTSTLKATKVKATLRFETDILFDRFSGDINRTSELEDKLYLDDKNRVIFPKDNIKSFLCYGGGRGDLAVKILATENWKVLADLVAGQVHVMSVSPFMRNGEPVVYEGIDKNGVYMHTCKAGGGNARDGGKKIPPTILNRPALHSNEEYGYVELNLTILIMESEKVKEEYIRFLFERGGWAIGLGSFRTEYGKFSVKEWEVVS